MPSRVYNFLLDALREKEYKLPDDFLYQSVDALETTEDCFRFYAGTECILALALSRKNEAIELSTFMRFVNPLFAV